MLRSRPVLSLGKWLSTARFGRGAVSLHVGPAYAADTQTARLDDGALGTELVLELDELPAGVDQCQALLARRDLDEQHQSSFQPTNRTDLI